MESDNRDDIKAILEEDTRQFHTRPEPEARFDGAE